MQMTTLFKIKFEEFITNEGLEPGQTPATITALTALFQSKYPDLPVTKFRMGRALSSKFARQQMYVWEEKALTQCYFLNKELV